MTASRRVGLATSITQRVTFLVTLTQISNQIGALEITSKLLVINKLAVLHLGVTLGVSSQAKP